MSDLSQLSDDDLMAIVGGQKEVAPANTDLSGMSNADLLKAISGVQPERKRYPDTFGGNIAQAVEDYVPQGVRDVARQARSGLTLGASDVIPGMFGGRPAQELQAETAAALERHPYAGEAAKIGGMMLPLAATGGVVGAGAGALRAVPMLGRVAANPLTQAAATGALTGGAEAGFKGDDIGEGAALGGLFGAGGQALGSAVGGAIKGAGDMASRSVGPTSDELMALKNKAYQAVKESGARFGQEPVLDLQSRVAGTLDRLGYEPSFAPEVGALQNKLKGLNQAKSATPEDVDKLMKMTNPLTQQIGSQYKKTLGGNLRSTMINWLNSQSPNEAQVLTDARSLGAKVIKDRMIQNALQKAESRAAESGRGGNLQNTIRQEIGKLKNRSVWSDAEMAAIKEISEGTRLMNAGRHISGLSPTTGALMMAGAGAMAYPTGGASLIPALGAAAVKKAADMATARKVGLLADLVRSGGKLPPPNAMQRLGPSISPLIARGLLAGGLGAM